ncbi:MAG: hypothetical protein JNL83_35645 [Myxococcales bacterium]|nr:hypothetical protein [Myxococcales bacterium]
MRPSYRFAQVLLLSCVVAESALAQPAAPTTPTTPAPTAPAPTAPPAPVPAMPTDPGAAGYAAPWAPGTPPPADAPPPAEEKRGKKEPRRGDFDAGGQARFPSGPDEMGAYDSFNWVAVDLKGRYFVLDSISANGFIPLAVKHPDSLAGGLVEPELFGGMRIDLEAKLPKLPKLPGIKYETAVGLGLTAAYMREGAMLLSDKDYPLFVGDLQPGLAGTLLMNVKLSSLVDFTLNPAFVFQTGEAENLTALQIPMALVLKLGDVVKLSADLGVFTGDDLSLRAKNGGRVYLGAALDVKIGRIVTHLGAGFASLLTDEMGAYPTIKDSVYLDLNVTFAK